MSQVQKPVRVLVEMRMRKADRAIHVLHFAGPLVDAGFDLDAVFGFISVPPVPVLAHEFARLDLDAVIVRGTIDPHRIALLEAKPEVIGVWHDGPIPQFHPISMEQRAPCPNPDFDCTNGGGTTNTIADVANYLGVDKIWAAGNRGAGVVVGLVDCGVCALGRQPRPGETPIIPNVIGGHLPDWGTTSEMSMMWHDHGNMTATDILGMAPQASLYDLRITDRFTGDEGVLLSNALMAYDWAINRHRRDGTPHILSNSWGLHKPDDEPGYATDPNHPLTRMILQAIDEGILMLFSAGNCGAACPAPYCGVHTGGGNDIWGANGHQQVMTVGAANLSDQLAGYSGTGPSALNPSGIKPDFCSMTHFKGYYPTAAHPNACDAGTSAATAIAAGVAALLKEGCPDLTQEQAMSVLTRTAKPIGPNAQYSGAGVIQAKAAWDALAPALTG